MEEFLVSFPAILALEDGSIFYGEGFGEEKIDVGELAIKFPEFSELKNSTSGLSDYLSKELSDVINSESSRPEKPKDIVLYGFGRIGRLVARMMIQNTGPGNYYRLRAIVIRKAGEDDIYKRASLLTRDSVHGSFDGTVRVDEEKSLLVINGNPVKVIYASGPSDIDYNDYGIHNPIVIDNTGVWRDQEGLTKHITSGAAKAILTKPYNEKTLSNTMKISKNIYKN